MNAPVTFDPATVDTPAGLAPELSIASITGVPSSGTGLLGAVFVPGTKIWNIDMARDAAANAADLTFTASEVFYGARKSDTSVAEFLGEDAASLSGDGTGLEMGPSALTFSGYIFIPAGTHEIAVSSDDGFAMEIGGVDFTSFTGTRATDETARVADFEGGLYEIDILYFDAGGAMTIGLEIDGLPVDQSAFYQSVADFQNPPADVAVVPVDQYHPSYFLGEESLDVAVNGAGTEGRDVMNGQGADDHLIGGGGDDELMGWYGDDILEGGDGDDVLDGGRGSDVLMGGNGNDLLIARSDAGEQKIGQYVIDMPTRGDPDGEVNPDFQKLAGYEYQPLHGDDVLIGGEGQDTFLIAPQLNAKADIIEKHVQADGSIKWSAVAGENDKVHDHWTDSFGIDIIADYDASEDHIAVIGHTANVYVEHKDVIGDEALESIITVISRQHGGGGAHDMDLIGQVIVHGDLVNKDDIQTDAGVTYGIVEGYDDVAEALYPQGDTKITDVGGTTYYGYDSRSPSDGATKDTNNGMGTENTGPITGDPAAAFENANFDETMLSAPAPDSGIELTRDPFDQLGTVDVAGTTVNGTGGADTLGPTEAAEPSGLPGAIGYWSFADGMDGAFADARGEGPAIKAYSLYENQALLRTDGATDGPGGLPDGALYFDGEDDFAYMAHDASYQVTQGTITMWVRPDDLSDKSMFVTKDQSGSGDGGHFRLGHTNEGGLFLRMAPGDGGSNRSWETDANLLSEGEWQHLAVSFTDTGVNVYVDGALVPANAWTPVEGNDPSPNGYTEGFFLMNEEPWVFGADQHRTELNDTAQEFGTDAEDLRHPLEGAIADFGLWGGFTAEDALSAPEIKALITDGPGDALVNPSGPEAMLAADNTYMAGGGNDTVEGGAGDEVLMGEGGNDTLNGGYGDDHLIGGAGNDVMDGGRGNDLLEGGDGDDTLISRSDVGEDRAGQLVLGDPSRPYPDASIDPEYLKLIDWVDQPLAGDDVLVGGDGADHFQFETLINAKTEFIAEHTNEDRTIDWMGVAGENARIHNHWVDSIGVDVIADYDKSEGDTISIKGHTTQIEVDYATIDTDGDGVDDEAVSIVTVYSQQGGGGGAHDEDYLGYVVVHGDKVTAEDIATDAKVAYGIVDTIDEIQEAVAPTGEAKTHTDPNLFGYDSRDVAGDPIGSNPEAYSSNPWLLSGQVAFDDDLPEGLDAPGILMTHDGGNFGGADQPVEIAHDPSFATGEGTYAFSFTAYNPGNGQNQSLLSKDHSGFKDGGHLDIYLNPQGVLKVRYQGEDSETFLYDWGTKIQPGQEYHVAFTFDDTEAELYLDGQLLDVEAGFAEGMTGNEEDIMLGASTRIRSDDDDNPQWHFDGQIGDVVLLDRPLEEVEVLFLAGGGGDLAALNPLYDQPLVESDPADVVDPVDAGEPVDTGETASAGDPADTGDTGDVGDAGASGDAGDAGDAGDTGDAGNTGNPGGDTGTGDDGAIEAGEDTGSDAPADAAPTPPADQGGDGDMAREDAPDMTEDEPEAPGQPEVMEEEDDESGVAALLQGIIDILTSLFGSGDDAPDAEAPGGAQAAQAADELDTLIEDIIPTYQIDEDAPVEDPSEDEELDAAA